MGKVKETSQTVTEFIGAALGFIFFSLVALYLTARVYEVEGIEVITLIGLCAAIGTLLMDMTIERWKAETEEEDE
jgi:hypothetical protein